VSRSLPFAEIVMPLASSDADRASEVSLSIEMLVSAWGGQELPDLVFLTHTGTLPDFAMDILAQQPDIRWRSMTQSDLWPGSAPGSGVISDNALTLAYAHKTSAPFYCLSQNPLLRGSRIDGHRWRDTGRGPILTRSFKPDVHDDQAARLVGVVEPPPILSVGPAPFYATEFMLRLDAIIAAIAGRPTVDVIRELDAFGTSYRLDMLYFAANSASLDRLHEQGLPSPGQCEWITPSLSDPCAPDYLDRLFANFGRLV